MFKIGDLEFVPVLRSPRCVNGVVSAALLWPEAMSEAELLAVLAEGDIRWTGAGDSTEWHDNRGLRGLEIDRLTRVVQCSWETERVSAPVEEQLREENAALKALVEQQEAQISGLKELVELQTEALLELGEIVGGSPAETEEGNG